MCRWVQTESMVGQVCVLVKIPDHLLKEVHWCQTPCCWQSLSLFTVITSSDPSAVHFPRGE